VEAKQRLGRAFSALGVYRVCNPQGVALGFRWAAPLALEPEALGSEKIVKKLECARAAAGGWFSIAAGDGRGYILPIESSPPPRRREPFIEVTKLDLTAAPASDPTQAYRYRDGIYAADLLTAGLVWLDFFTWLAPRPRSSEDICRELGLHPRPVDVMLTLFCAMGFLQREGGAVSLTGVARDHLVQGSPWFLGPYYASLKDRPVTKDYLEILRTGAPANWGGLRHEKEWSKAMEGEAFATQFTAAMDCRGAFLGQALSAKLDLASCRSLLDVAGGSGIYACALLARHTHLRATVMDRPPVDQIARTLVERRGFGARISIASHDMFQGNWPGGHDAHLISNVLHDWDFPQVRELLRHSFDSMAPGGLLMVHDAHVNLEKDGPLPVAAYSALLMHSTQGKCYSLGEMQALLAEAGFVGFSFTPTVVDRSVITARKPAA
jgi:predicted O-methyltransferase YrrM